MNPPDRLAHATFASYSPRTPSQRKARDKVHAFVEAVSSPRSWMERLARFFTRSAPPRHGLYLVGPVGTGKTHLLAAAHHFLTPQVPAAFIHMSTITRLRERPSAYARKLADAFDVVCLDELEIDDAANEARLVTILQVLEKRGVSLLASSNVTPARFMTNELGTGRFTTFIQAHFEESYDMVWVRGEDFRRREAGSGTAWIGSPEATQAEMRAHAAETTATYRWLPFSELMDLATERSHERVLAQLKQLDALYVEGIDIETTDDALRLLRLIDALYLDDDAPTLYFTSSSDPEDWFRNGEGGASGEVAFKFSRTVSRIRALCSIEKTPSPSATNQP